MWPWIFTQILVPNSIVQSRSDPTGTSCPHPSHSFASSASCWKSGVTRWTSQPVVSTVADGTSLCFCFFFFILSWKGFRSILALYEGTLPKAVRPCVIESKEYCDMITKALSLRHALSCNKKVWLYLRFQVESSWKRNALPILIHFLSTNVLWGSCSAIFSFYRKGRIKLCVQAIWLQTGVCILHHTERLRSIPASFLLFAVLAIRLRPSSKASDLPLSSTSSLMWWLLSCCHRRVECSAEWCQWTPYGLTLFGSYSILYRGNRDCPSVNFQRHKYIQRQGFLFLPLIFTFIYLFGGNGEEESMLQCGCGGQGTTCERWLSLHGANLGNQAWWQVLLLADPFCWLPVT